MSSRICVVAGIIWNQQRDQLLISLRKPEQHQGNLWEFPGGKVEAGEQRFDALKRELEEELDIRVIKAESWFEISHDYPDKSVLLDFWQVSQFDGEPKSAEQQKLVWVPTAQLRNYTFPAANQPVVDRLLEEQGAC